MRSGVNLAVLVQIRIDQVEVKFGGIGFGRDRVPDCGKVGGGVGDGSVVAGLAAGEKAELVKLPKGG